MAMLYLCFLVFWYSLLKYSLPDSEDARPFLLVSIEAATFLAARELDTDGALF